MILTVPFAQPSAGPVSSMLRSSSWRSTTTARIRGGNSASARRIAPPSSCPSMSPNASPDTAGVGQLVGRPLPPPPRSPGLIQKRRNDRPARVGLRCWFSPVSATRRRTCWPALSGRYPRRGPCPAVNMQAARSRLTRLAPTKSETSQSRVVRIMCTSSRPGRNRPRKGSTAKPRHPLPVPPRTARSPRTAAPPTHGALPTYGRSPNARPLPLRTARPPHGISPARHLPRRTPSLHDAFPARRFPCSTPSLHSTSPAYGGTIKSVATLRQP